MTAESIEVKGEPGVGTFQGGIIIAVNTYVQLICRHSYKHKIKLLQQPYEVLIPICIDEETDRNIKNSLKVAQLKCDGDNI